MWYVSTYPSPLRAARIAKTLVFMSHGLPTCLRGPRRQFENTLTLGSGTKQTADQHLHRHSTLVVSTFNGAFDEELRKTLPVVEGSRHCVAVSSGAWNVKGFRQRLSIQMASTRVVKRPGFEWSVLTPVDPTGRRSLMADRRLKRRNQGHIAFADRKERKAEDVGRFYANA